MRLPADITSQVVEKSIPEDFSIKARSASCFAFRKN